jgi:SSS family transporter
MFLFKKVKAVNTGLGNRSIPEPVWGLVVLILLIGSWLYSTGHNVHWPGFISIMVFYLLIFYIGCFASRKFSSGKLDDLMLAGRKLPLGLAVFTMSATWVGGGYINGSAEYAYSNGLAWVQAPWGYSLSLIIGGLLFAAPMRRRGYKTMLDPLQQRFGKKISAILFLPAVTGELFWSGAILVALSTTFATVLNLDTRTSIIISAVIVIAYTVIGGLWAVALTDTIQLVLIFAGLWLVIPTALPHVGGLSNLLEKYSAATGSLGGICPPWDWKTDPNWGNYFWNWWDYLLLLALGGIPWQVYFQRVLAARSATTARNLSILAAFVCFAAAIPAILIGMIGHQIPWGTGIYPAPPENAASILPYVIQYCTNPVVAAIGLGAVAAAVMSSMDSSILSAASMSSWNVYRLVRRKTPTPEEMKRVLHTCIIIVGIAATLVALNIQSVYQLWILCSDFVYCILFAQLLCAIYDHKANRIGSIAGIAVSFILRFGGGEPALGIPRLIPYPMITEDGVVLFPFRTLSMVAGLITIIAVSRLTQKRCPPEGLSSVE